MSVSKLDGNKKNIYSLIDLKTRERLSLKVKNEWLNNGFIVKKDTKFGYLSKDGRYKISTIYDKLSFLYYTNKKFKGLEESVFLAEKGKFKGLVNINGDWIYKYKGEFSFLISPLDNVILLEEGKYAKFIDLKGVELYKDKSFILIKGKKEIDAFFINKNYDKSKNYIFITGFDNRVVWTKNKLGFLRNNEKVEPLNNYKSFRYIYASRYGEFFDKKENSFLMNLSTGKVLDWSKNTRNKYFAEIFSYFPYDFFINIISRNKEKIIRQLIGPKGNVILKSDKKIKIGFTLFESNNELWSIYYIKNTKSRRVSRIAIVHENGNIIKNYERVESSINGYLVEKNNKRYFLYSKNLSTLEKLDKIEDLQFVEQSSPRLFVFRKKKYFLGIFPLDKYDYMVYDIEKDELRDLIFHNKDKFLKDFPFHFFLNRVLKLTKFDKSGNKLKQRKVYRSIVFDENLNYLFTIRDDVSCKDGYLMNEKNIYNLKGEKLKIKNIDGFNFR